jgi:hypothetical protein
VKEGMKIPWSGISCWFLFCASSSLSFSHLLLINDVDIRRFYVIILDNKRVGINDETHDTKGRQEMMSQTLSSSGFWSWWGRLNIHLSLEIGVSNRTVEFFSNFIDSRHYCIAPLFKSISIKHRLPLFTWSYTL